MCVNAVCGVIHTSHITMCQTLTSTDLQRETSFVVTLVCSDAICTEERVTNDALSVLTYCRTIISFSQRLISMQVENVALKN